MSEDTLEQPIFVIGMPRSGTTIVFEALARHPHLGWLSNYCRLYPKALWVNVVRRILDNRLVHLYGHKKQYGDAAPYNVLLPQPDEAYEFWDTYAGVPFARDALLDRSCHPSARAALRDAAARVVSWQDRQRFATKLTGPPRMQFLLSIFPDAYFVHVIRDGRAVTDSLLNVTFWREKGGLERPFWEGLLGTAEIALWRQSGRDPAVLAGLQWKRVIELARIEAAESGTGRYLEIRYEEFVAAPHETIRKVLDACGLPDSAPVHGAVDRGPGLRNMNAKYRGNSPSSAVQVATESMQPLLQQLGYE